MILPPSEAIGTLLSGESTLRHEAEYSAGWRTQRARKPVPPRASITFMRGYRAAQWKECFECEIRMHQTKESEAAA